MWILPKQLHTSAYVLDTAALISDLDEQSQICEPSLLARSKPSLARTWSQRWKRDCWTQHLSGRILKPSHGQSFVTAWTSSLEVIPASHSVQQGNDSEQKIHDISGHLSQPELFPCDQESASSRTLKDTSASDSERSLANWKALVTRLRGEYSQRVKLKPLINASESSSWPTCAARDYKGESGSGRQERKGNPADTLPNAVAQQHGQVVPVSPSTDGNRLESWATPSTMMGSMYPEQNAHKRNSPSLATQAAWATPSTMDHINVVRNPEERSPAANKGGCKNLREEVHQWATPRTGATDNSRPNNKGGIPLGDQARRAEQWGTPRCSMAQDKQEDSGKHRLGEQAQHGTTAKLNPRWVETLMGLPIGWTMPSCSSPLTIAPMNSDCLATESCLQQQSELF